ncbi:DUF6283 family protein [Streptomyces lydicus]|uniref:DUF6283 family protein n=1 Tax=Streptomyces lydicus TaxID=47763 RepID=UPI0034016AD1
MATQPPAPRPCTYCQYRTDVPSGIWSQEDYEKLPLFDGPTGTQRPKLFVCHVHDYEDDHVRVCGGWAGCHDGDQLLAVRVAASMGEITVDTAEAIRDYVSPVPLFATGAEAAAHGMREILTPGPEARRAIQKICRTRSNLT